MLFYNARYYSTGIIRFISADTIVPDPTNPQTLNRYAYGLNNPVKYQDPDGHKPTAFDENGASGIGYSGPLMVWSDAPAVPDTLLLAPIGAYWGNIAAVSRSNSSTLDTWGDPTCIQCKAPGPVATKSQSSIASAAEQTATGTEVASSSEIPAGYSAENWAARQQVVAKEGGMYNCAYCARAMNKTFGDAVGTITTDSPFTPLLGTDKDNAGAPKGWHMFTIDRQGNATDNFGFKGNPGDFLQGILGANTNVHVSVFNNFWDAWKGVIEPFQAPLFRGQ